MLFFAPPSWWLECQLNGWGLSSHLGPRSGRQVVRAAGQRDRREPGLLLVSPQLPASKLILIDAPRELTTLPSGGPFPAFSFTGVEENLGTAAWGRTTNHTGVAFPSHEMSTGRSEDADGQMLSEHREKTAGLPIPRPGQPWAP